MRWRAESLKLPPSHPSQNWRISFSTNDAISHGTYFGICAACLKTEFKLLYYYLVFFIVFSNPWTQSLVWSVILISFLSHRTHIILGDVGLLLQCKRPRRDVNPSAELWNFSNFDKRKSSTNMCHVSELNIKREWKQPGSVFQQLWKLLIYM